MRILDYLVKPSTRVFWAEAQKRPGGSLWESLHGLFYLKWPELYISVGLGRAPFAKALRNIVWHVGMHLGLWSDKTGARFADTYHGKVMPLESMKRLIRVDRPVRVTVPEQVLPYSIARDIILDNPADLVLLRCPCRATVKNPCLPLEVCVIVGQPFVDFMLEHHPAKCRRISADEALAVVAAAQKRGNVSHAFFKEAVLGRYYAVCNCCSCCCGAMQAYRQGVPMLASSGYVPRVDEEACVACGLCATVCPFGAVGADAGGRPLVRAELCMGCGVCAVKCPKQALSLERDATKPAPLEVPEYACP